MDIQVCNLLYFIVFYHALRIIHKKDQIKNCQIKDTINFFST